MHYANQAIYSHNYGLVYLSPTAITARLDQNLECWQLPTERGDEGWACYFLYSTASIHTEACPLRQLHGFDSMEWEGPSLPRVWYNESELTKHDLRLSQISYLKQLKPETVQQTALIHLYTCTGFLFLSVSRMGGGVMCFNVWQRVIRRWRKSTERHRRASSFASIHSEL